MQQVEQLAIQVDISQACQALGVPRSRLYRTWQSSGPSSEMPRPHSPSPRALSAEVQEQVRQVLDSPRFQDAAPCEVYATLLDEGH